LINDNLFAVYEERAGTLRVHPAIADVLRNMEDDGVISCRALVILKTQSRFLPRI